jgi:iron complex outermembrane receptor protein
LKAFGSYSHATANNYVGPGRNKKDHVDFRVQEDWSSRSRSTLFVSFDALTNSRLPILNRVQSLDGIENDRLDQYAFSATYVPGVTTQYYKINQAFTKSLLISNNNDVALSDNIKLHVIPYYKYYDSLGGSQTKLSPTSIFNGNTKVTPAYDPSQLQAGSLVANAATHYRQFILGVNSYVEASLSPTNQLSFGYWYQHTRLTYDQNVQLVDQQGNFPGFGPDTALKTTGGAVITGLSNAINTSTNQLFIGDTQSFFDGRLAFTLGIKQLFWSADVDNFVVGATPRLSARWSRPMPRFLASFKIDDQNQLYANVTTNARMPLPTGTYVTSFSVSSGAFTAVGNTAIKPEYTISTQIGYRYNGPIHLDVAAFYMKLKNHQVTGTSYVNGFLQTTALSAGDESIRGFSLEASTKKFYGISLYGNAQYLDGRFDDNVPLRGDFLPTKGKRMVLSPRWMSNVGARFDSGYKYVAKQYSTFMNDETIPSISTFDAAMGYKLPDLGALKSPVIRLTVTNIGNKPYISTLSAAQPNAVATKGINGTVMPAGVPTYYIGATRAALLTISTEF